MHKIHELCRNPDVRRMEEGGGGVIKYSHKNV